MPIAENMYLPSEEELKVQEINISTPFLKAGAIHFGKFCDDECKEFMLCRREESDPRKCLDEGKAVTSCGLKFFQQVKKLCRQELENYAACLEHHSPAMNMHYCRKSRAPMDLCMLEKIGIERPPLGFFTEIRVHKTDRPKPEPIWPVKEYKDTRPELSADYPRDKSKYGNLLFFD